MCCIDAFKNLRRTILAVGCGLLLGATAQADIIISEVAPWSSGNSPVGADWFELTNTGLSAVDITGWKFDDGGSSFAAAALLEGITSIASGESVIFLEADDEMGAPTPAEYAAAFKSNWFGDAPPAGLQIGTYSGSGLSMSTGGDGANIFDSSGVEIWGLVFGPSPENAPFATFDNAAGLKDVTISLLSSVGVNGAFVAAGSATEIGSPGTIVTVPEPTSAILLVAAAGIATGLRKRRSVR